MGQIYPPVIPASGLLPSDHLSRQAVNSRQAAIEISLRELCDLQAHAARLAVAIQSINGPDFERPANGDPCDEAFIRGILKARLARGRYFPSDLFTDPAWDMLLGLYAAELGQQRVSVSSHCITANVPATTALRWIAFLERERLIDRRADPLDGRRYFLSLSAKASNALAQYFSETPRAACSS